MTKIEYILTEHQIKQTDILHKSWELAVAQEKSKKSGLFNRGILKQNLGHIVKGKGNPTIKTFKKLARCINDILKDNDVDMQYKFTDLIGEIENVIKK